MGVVVRKATRDDLTTVIDLRLEFLAHVRGPDYQAPPGFTKKTVDFAEREFESNQLHIWLAEEPPGVGVKDEPSTLQPVSPQQPTGWSYGTNSCYRR